MEITQSIFLTSVATLAGMGATISFVATPAILGSPNPLPCWRILCSRGRNFALATIFMTTTSGLLIYYHNGDHRFLSSAILTIFLIPYTKIFLTPIGTQLLALTEKDEAETKESAYNLIGKWSRAQLIQTIVALSAFAFGLHAVVLKPQNLWGLLKHKTFKH